MRIRILNETYERNQLEIIHQCNSCRKNFDNSCPFLDMDEQRLIDCKYFKRL